MELCTRLQEEANPRSGGATGQVSICWTQPSKLWTARTLLGLKMNLPSDA